MTASPSPDIMTPGLDPQPAFPDATVSPAKSERRDPLRGGLAWWMIAIAGPASCRGSAAASGVEPDKVPWVLLLRAARDRRSTNFFAWPMLTCGILTFLAAQDLPRLAMLAIAAMVIQQMCLLCYFISAVGVVTAFPAWLKRSGAATDVVMAPIPGPDWAAAQARLFIAVIGWCVVATVVPMVPGVVRAARLGSGGRNVSILALSLGVYATFPWALCFTRTAGGWKLRTAMIALLAVFPVAFACQDPLREFVEERVGFVEAFIFDEFADSLWPNLIPIAAAVLVGRAGMKRSARHYPEILRRMLFP